MGKRNCSVYVRQSAEKVLAAVSAFYRVSPSELLPGSRAGEKDQRNPAEHRLVAQYLMREHYDLRPIEISELFDLNPSTVTINYKRIGERRQSDKWLEMRIKSLKMILEEEDNKQNDLPHEAVGDRFALHPRSG